jgi:hypothetical protein
VCEVLPFIMAQEDVLAMARRYLQMRGFTAACEVLTSRPRDVKLNDMLQRDASLGGQNPSASWRAAQGDGRRHALHVDPKVEMEYEESYEQLDNWIRSRSLEEQKELQLLRFPMYVHCFLALVVRSGGAKEKPERFGRAHAAEHEGGGSLEKKRQVEQLLHLVQDENQRNNLANSSIAKIYLTQRVTWVCSASSFEAVTRFFVEQRLHLLLRIFILYFNVHSIRRNPPPLPPPAAAAAAASAGAASSSSGGASAPAGATALAASTAVAGAPLTGSTPAEAPGQATVVPGAPAAPPFVFSRALTRGHARWEESPFLS